jgi:molybdopterin converting factor small subunit
MELLRVRALGVARSFMEEKREVPYARRMTLKDLLALLPEEIRGMAERRELAVIVNGTEVTSTGGLEVELEDGEEVVLLPYAHGG